MTQQTLILFFLQQRAESGAEAIVLGFVSVIAVIIFFAISAGIKKVTAKKKDAEKLR